MNFTGPGGPETVDFRQKSSVYGVQKNLLIQLESVASRIPGRGAPEFDSEGKGKADRNLGTC